MNNRWQANRFGFINFWLYDEETFEFDNGKMLLRGENASGKSITTQSIIPFILDGDRSPERLDPFGSRDRKMEYYFLGDSDREESTGYMFLEFVKKNSNQYRTIGIGQRARKGKPMTFWGFVILDNRRIGNDIQLYKQVGDKKIPKTKLELKNDLGEHNQIVESSRDYMEMVNKYIFKFPRIELYEQFIKLLIKVRAPKLSKDLKPSLVYTILNDSLQTLSDDDLSAMVAAMEQLDTMQATIDDLNETLRNIIIIRNEYDRYNRYMLGTKAGNYKENHKLFIKFRDTFESNIKAKEQCLVDIEKNALRNEQIVRELAMYYNEIEMLDSNEMQEQIARRDKLEIEQKDSMEAKIKLEDNQEKVKDDAQGYESKVLALQDNIQALKYDMGKEIHEVQDLNESVLFDMDISLALFEEQEQFEKNFKSNLKIYEKSIQMGLEALIKHDELEKRFSINNEKFGILADKITKLKQDSLASQRLVDQSRDIVIEAYHILNKENRVLVFEPQSFNTILHHLNLYASYEDYKDIHNQSFQTYSAHQKRIQRNLNTYEFERREIEHALNEATFALATLKEMKEVVPMRRDKVMKTRAYLKQENVVCQPFYELIEFSDGTSDAQRNLLEEQLLVSGMLDALVIDEIDYQRLKQDWELLTDVVLVGKQPVNQPFTKFKVSDQNHPLAKATAAILACISDDVTSDAQLVFAEDGYYKNGLLEGHCIADQTYSYVGALIRQARLQEEIKEKEAIVNVINEQYKAQLRKVLQEKELLSTLECEYNNLPVYANLNEALSLLKGIQDEINREEIHYREMEQIVSTLLKEKNDAYQKVIHWCAKLPLNRKIEAYKEAKDCCYEMIELFQSITDAFHKCSNKQEQISVFQSTIEELQNRLEDISLSISKIDNEIRIQQEEIKKINNFLNSSENKDIIKKLEIANTKVKKLQKESDDNKTEIIKRNANMEGYETQIREAEETINQKQQEDELLYLCFEEELELGYLVKKDGRDTSTCVDEAYACLRAQDVERSVGDITSALNKNFQQHATSLTKYGSRLEDLFQDHPKFIRRRLVINSSWLGRTVSLEEFYNVIKEEIENNELLLEKKDRDLFENILSNTLSQKLSNRIVESQKWIDEMSNLMEQMDTSMGLSFSLKWKPKPPESNQELKIDELNVLLRRNNALLTKEDIEKVSNHFRSKIKTAKQIAEDKGELFNYQDLIRDALDYRKWFEFHMRYHRTNGEWKELTNSTFNTYSGGEKAMAMYVPLFAAVNVQYKKCEKEDHPRIIALDEAFAGVDDKNIDVMFHLLETIDLDYIMNSQALWGCYPSVHSIHISELLRPVNSSIVTVINYHWNGVSREVVD